MKEMLGDIWIDGGSLSDPIMNNNKKILKNSINNKKKKKWLGFLNLLYYIWISYELCLFT